MHVPLSVRMCRDAVGCNESQRLIEGLQRGKRKLQRGSQRGNERDEESNRFPRIVIY